MLPKHRMDVGRRRVLAALALTALGPAGCALCGPSHLGPHSRATPNSLNFGSPHKAAGAPALAFDAHTHIFNASDLPAHEFLQAYVESTADPDLRELILQIAPLVETLAAILTPTAAVELLQLDDYLSPPDLPAQGVRAEARLANLRRHRQRFQQQFAHEFSSALPRDGRKFEQAARRYLEKHRAKLFPLKIDGMSPRPAPLSAPDILNRLRKREPARELRIEALRVEPPTPALDSAIGFAFDLISPRIYNLLRLFESYSTDRDAFGIDAYFVDMLDFNYWLGAARGPSCMRDEIALTEQLAIAAGGGILPIAPYNPWTDLVRKDESFNAVVAAVTTRGFVGVKIYPAMGYLPYGNADCPSPPGARWPDIPMPGAAIDAKLKRLYVWCRDNAVPVMAHGSSSNGANKAANQLGAPEHWRKALTKVPGLRVHIGHFGGDGDETCKAGLDWTRGFAALMQESIGANLYADLAYWDKIAIPEPACPAATLLGELLMQPLGNGAHVYDRAMYGTDWYMPTLLEFAQGYPQVVARFLRNIKRAPADLADRVYAGNAIKLYGLRRQEPNRMRLEKYYRDHAIPTPAWFAKVDARF